MAKEIQLYILITQSSCGLQMVRRALARRWPLPSTPTAALSQSLAVTGRCIALTTCVSRSSYLWAIRTDYVEKCCSMRPFLHSQELLRPDRSKEPASAYCPSTCTTGKTAEARTRRCGGPEAKWRCAKGRQGGCSYARRPGHVGQ